jgi:hypothetical protein
MVGLAGLDVHPDYDSVEPREFRHRPTLASSSPGRGLNINAVGCSREVSMFERLTERARRAFFCARDETSQLGSTSIDTEHLLPELIREGKGLTDRLFADAGIGLDEIRDEVLRRVPARSKTSTSAETLRAEPKVARLLLRKLIGPLELVDESQNPNFVDADTDIKPALLEGLQGVEKMASPRGCARVGAPETFVEGRLAA